DSDSNVLEVVGILKSYGVVLDAYSKNLIYIADHQFLVLFPFFKYFNGWVTLPQLLRHWWHDRINFEYAEYCMKTMLWHGGGKLDAYLDSNDFMQRCESAVAAKIKANPPIRALNGLFPDFLPEQVRQLAYYSALGQFWRVMSDLFIDLSDAYDRGEVTTIPQVVAFIKAGLVAAAANPITYSVEIDGQRYDLMPKSAELTFLMDVAVPYVEAVFFRGTPFLGTVSYNAQADQISADQGRFEYGALYADPLPIGGAGIPPTLLMQDMRHYLPDYLTAFYESSGRGLDDVRVKICQSFQKSMFCVTSASLQGLLPHPADTQVPSERAANHAFLAGWMDRLATSRLDVVQL
ncbi:MAG TPA: CO2 hydration protein, partial [Nodosilinea sp.]|nr:CO2 hydration protein [Nodosilinea sp.]